MKSETGEVKRETISAHSFKRKKRRLSMRKKRLFFLLTHEQVTP